MAMVPPMVTGFGVDMVDWVSGWNEAAKAIPQGPTPAGIIRAAGEWEKIPGFQAEFQKPDHPGGPPQPNHPGTDPEFKAETDSERSARTGTGNRLLVLASGRARLLVCGR